MTGPDNGCAKVKEVRLMVQEVRIRCEQPGILEGLGEGCVCNVSEGNLS